MGSVFVNYRREETAGEARALFNGLAASLGRDSVFMDVDNIALGRDFRLTLQERLASCDLMLALIGKGWADLKDSAGQRRLDNTNDYIRLEIAAALKRNIPVLPVLVQGAQMPAPETLPEDIKDFAFRNAFELSHTRWESDLHEMLKRLGLAHQPPASAMPESFVEIQPSAGRPVGGKRSSGALGRQKTAAVWAVVIALVGGGLLYFDARDKAKTEQTRLQIEKAKAEAAAKESGAKAETERARRDAESAKAAAEAAAALPRLEAKYLVCLGERRERCPASAIFLPCFSSVADWASKECPKYSGRQISSFSGNKCGYTVVEITCVSGT